MEQEIAKYVKKKPSSVSSAAKKANHKHDWQDAVVGYHRKPSVLFEETHVYGLGKYCTICDKVRLRSWWYQKDGWLYDDLLSLQQFFPNYPIKEKEDEQW